MNVMLTKKLHDWICSLTAHDNIIWEAAGIDNYIKGLLDGESLDYEEAYKFERQLLIHLIHELSKKKEPAE